MSRLRNMQKKDFMNSNFNVYGLYAYDTIWVIARSIDRFLKEHGNMSFSLGANLQLRNVKVFDGGGLLLDIISKTNFTGLTGQVKFDADNNLMNIDYEIINVVGETTFKVGYWSNDTGLSVQSPESLKRNKFVSTVRGQKLDIITWPGGEVEKPRGWVVATAEKPLRIGVPKTVSFTEFEDFCIDLFNEVLKMVPYEVPFRFEPFGDGLNNPSYDELVRMVADDIFDAAVGDIAIVTNRTKVVDFTQPFVATGLVVLAPIENSISSGWVFLKPFTLEMWCVTAASFVIIAVVIWMLEHRVNDDFRGPPRRQMQKMFLFSFSTLFKANREKVVSTLGKFVMVVWLFILLVITSSYTASLSSILTVQQLSTPITGINSLISSGLPIGFQVGSFAYSYMMDSLDIHRSRLVSLGSPEEYESALRRGPTNGGVAAIVDEIPYVELFLSKQSDFGIVGQTFTRSGWGFAFQKGSPLAADMSTAILNLAESGQLEKIHDKWFCKPGSCPEERMRKSEDNRLHLKSFLALYSFCGIFALTAFFIFLIRAVRQYIKYATKQMDPSASSLSMSSNIVFGQAAVRNFLKFFDEKEEAVKGFFAQHGNPTTQVSQ
ncbi:hypothetical protein BUALT_Bualt18G0013900 [Buddleja alternifolia]|uniref:Ionotropic glutamate receptor C-terminal domain-containing protein n=1 Tax=Buddleja alternifolia TaxID=168488 RepID=A0AAV6WC02_9LAMI|nr:hypothetical protein BUALT_Bualt18G0013900 [Buddleja alternifolia]